MGCRYKVFHPKQGLTFHEAREIDTFETPSFEPSQIVGETSATFPLIKTLSPKDSTDIASIIDYIPTVKTPSASVIDFIPSHPIEANLSIEATAQVNQKDSAFKNLQHLVNLEK